MNEKDQRSSIQDAVHGTMNFDYPTSNEMKWSDLKKHIYSIIENPSFQRLRHISQLGMANFVYPTAKHDRFCHSLGAAYLASLVLRRLHSLYHNSDEKKSDLINDDAKKYAFFGALLHDIGHGPFSHAFEQLLCSTSKSGLKEEKVIKHEDWTESFLTKGKDEGGFNDVIKALKIDPTILAKIINGNWKKDDANHSYEIAADIISSQIDVDRCDYLLRDSYFTGVPYSNIDLGWLLNHLYIFSVKELDNDTARLGVTEKGAQAAAHMILSRRRLHSIICYHKKILLMEDLLVRFLKKLAECCSCSEKSSLFNKLQSENKLTVSKPLKEFIVRAWGFSKKSFDDQKGEKEPFIDSNFKYYHKLIDYDVWMLLRDFAVMDPRTLDDYEDKNLSDLCHISRILYNKVLHQSYKIVPGHFKRVYRKLEKVKSKNDWRDWEVLALQCKVDTYDSSNEKTVWVKVASNTKKRYEDLKSVSSLVGFASKDSKKDSYLMIRKDSKEDLKKIKGKLEGELNGSVCWEKGK